MDTVLERITMMLGFAVPCFNRSLSSAAQGEAALTAAASTKRNLAMWRVVMGAPYCGTMLRTCGYRLMSARIVLDAWMDVALAEEDTVKRLSTICGVP